MADASPTGRAKWFWIIVILALLVLLIIWLLDPTGDVDETAVADPGAPQVEATGFVTAPTGPGVPVTLPDTPMTSAPAASPVP